MTDFKELREGDGYMPVLLTSAASIAVILKRLSKADSLEKNESVPNIMVNFQFQEITNFWHLYLQKR